MISIMSRIALTAIPTVMVLSMMPHNPTGFSDLNHELSEVLSAAATRRMNRNAGRGGFGFTTNSTTVESSSLTARMGSVDYMSTFSQQQRSNLSFYTDPRMANLGPNLDMLRLLPTEQREITTNEIKSKLSAGLLKQMQSDPAQFCQDLIDMNQQQFDLIMRLLAEDPHIEERCTRGARIPAVKANRNIQMEVAAEGVKPFGDEEKDYNCNESTTDEGSQSGDDDGSGSNASSEADNLQWAYTTYKQFYEKFYREDERYRVVCKEVGIVLLHDYLQSHHDYDHKIPKDESDHKKLKENETQRGQQNSTEPAQPEKKEPNAKKNVAVSAIREVFHPKKLNAWWETTREKSFFDEVGKIRYPYAELIVENGIKKLGGAFVKLSQVFPEQPCGKALFEMLKDCKDKAKEEAPEVIDEKFLEIQERLLGFDRRSQVINPNMRWERIEMCDDSETDIVKYKTKSLGSASIGTIHAVKGIRYSEAKRRAYIGQLTGMDPSEFLDDDDAAENGIEFGAKGNVVVKVRRDQVVANTRRDFRLWEFVQRKVDELGDMTKKPNAQSGQEGVPEQQKKGVNDKYQLVQTEIKKCFEHMSKEFNYTAEAKYTAIAHEVLKKIAKKQLAKREAAHHANAEVIVHAPKIYQEMEQEYIFMECVEGITLNDWANEQVKEFLDVVRGYGLEPGIVC